MARRSGIKYETQLILLLRAKGINAIEEHRFHPERRWRFDVAHPSSKVACEIQGAAFSKGKHSRGIGMQNDAEKGMQAALLGWTVIYCVPPSQLTMAADAFAMLVRARE